MINPVNNNKIQNLLAQQSENQAKSTAAEPPVAKNAELTADFNSLIQKAMQTDSEKEADAVQTAKKLLLSGQLDNIENIRKAAQSIIDFGI